MTYRNPYEIWKLQPKSKKLCSCCAHVARFKVEVRVSYFRGDDEVYLACPDHEALLKQGKWDDFYYDFAMTNTKRRGDGSAENTKTNI